MAAEAEVEGRIEERCDQGECGEDDADQGYEKPDAVMNQVPDRKDGTHAGKACNGRDEAVHHRRPDELTPRELKYMANRPLGQQMLPIAIGRWVGVPLRFG